MINVNSKRLMSVLHSRRGAATSEPLMQCWQLSVF